MKNIFKTFLAPRGTNKCTKSPELPEALRGTGVSDHFIFIDSNGNMRDECNNEITKIEEVHKKIDGILSQFDSLKRENKDLSMTIYIHGGLNTFKETVERVENTYREILGDGQYPVFISWKADFWTNYGDHLWTIRNGEKKLSKQPKPSEPLKEWSQVIISTLFVFVEDVFRSIARAPAAYWNALTGKNSEKEEEIAKKIEPELEKLRFQVQRKGPSTGGSVLDFVKNKNPLKLATIPLADGFGKGAWRSMLRRTDLVLNSQAGFDGKGREGSETAAHSFLSKLEELDREKEYLPIKKVLIGHSMGAIVANNILSRFPEINFDTVVYMAAACKLKDLEKSVVPWLRRNKNGEFYNLTLNPYRDINESKYFRSIPRGSLLIWIDGFLEDVNSFEDRTAGYWYNVVRGADIIFPSDKDLRSRVHLTRYGIDRKYCAEGRAPKVPQTHGAFDDYDFWNKKFWENTEERRDFYEGTDTRLP